MVVDNTYDGFELFSVGSSQWVKTFSTAQPIIRFPKQVTFGECADIVAGGGDNGLVYVFDVESGNRIDVLRHSKEGMVQTVTVRVPIIVGINCSSDSSSDSS